MMRKRFALAALAAVALARPAHAQDPSPARVRAAEEVMAASDMERNYARTMDLMIDQQKRANPDVAQYETQMRAFFDRYIGWEQVRPEFVRIYASLYTEDELHQLAAFYRTPLGRRLMETTPELTARSTEVTQRLLLPHMSELVQSVMDAGPPPESGRRPAPTGTPKKP
jgi:hypothetical protein